jgi:hypothetical protein
MSNPDNAPIQRIPISARSEEFRKRAQDVAINLAGGGFSETDALEMIWECETVHDLDKLIGRKSPEFVARVNPDYKNGVEEKISFHPGAMRKMTEAAFSSEPMSPVAAAIGKPSLDLSSRPRRKIVMDQPVSVREPHEDALVLASVIDGLAGSSPEKFEAARLARALSQRLAIESSRAAQAMNDEVDALAMESLKRQGGDAPKIVSASDANLAGKASSSMARTGDVPLDKSMDAERWMNEAFEACAGLTGEAGDKVLAGFFRRALGAGIAAGRVRERGAMIEEMAPVFRNLEILDMWADRMNVKGGERGLPLHQDPDARRWAREFIETVDTLEQKAGHKLCDPATFDEGWLLSWFANAMMASYDWAMRQRDQADAARKRMRTAHVFGPLLLTTALQAAGAPLWDSVCSRTEKGETFKGLAIRIQPWKRENGKAAPQLAVVVAWKKRTGPSLWARIVGKSRLLYGFCPACNSDAPEVDRCEVCLGYRSADGVCEFPPSDARKAVWLKRWMEGKGVRGEYAEPMEGSVMSAVSDSAGSNVAAKSDTPEATCISSASDEVAKSNPERADGRKLRPGDAPLAPENPDAGEEQEDLRS